MQEMLSNPAYRHHVRTRDNQQTVMVGNSEYSADGSFASARWALQWAQTKLVELFDRENIEYTVFYGRSGEAARGGQAEDTAGGRLRATEHGEVVNERFGLRGIASRSLEKAFSAVAVATALPRKDTPEENAEWATIMNLIALTSRDAYKNLVFESGEFPDYFRQATPIDVIEHMRIGRQSDRPQQDYLAGNTRTLPWTFAWTLSRYLLPSWYGLGAGLAAAIDGYGTDVLIEMHRSWAFFQRMLEDAETALAIADFDIARRYSSLAGKLHNQYFPRIEAEFEQSVSAVLTVKQQTELLESSATLRRSIRLRNPYVDTMSLLQVDLLQRWRAADRDDEQLLSALLASVNGIARGLHSG
jgi:phosphoenolpyruvate carboxylase